MSVSYTTPQLHDPSQPPPTPGRTPAKPGYQPTRAQGDPEARRRTALNTERPLDVAPAPEGGAAASGQPGLPEGHANIGDKIVGKTQKMIGKYTNNPELLEKGELRETGGKAAVEGHTRAAHD